MITLKNIVFSYRRNATPALSDVTASIGPGVHLLVGENGAGKTTLLHMIAGLLCPSSGECLIDGKPAATDTPSEMGRTFMLDENMFFPGKSINDFARLHTRFYPRFSPQKFADNLSAFGLTGNELFKHQSLGNRKKARLAYALALGVDVLLLDEPTNGLDIQSKETLRRLLASGVSPSQTVIVATHTVSELENLFDAGLVLNRSSLVYAGTNEEVSRRLSFDVLRMPDPDALYQEIQVGRVLAIKPVTELNVEETKVDWRLLYSALHSDRRNAVLNHLKEVKSYE